AEDRLRRCLDRNACHQQALHLLVVALVTQDKREAAAELVERELQRDPFNIGVLFESALFLKRYSNECDRRMGDGSHSYIELAIDYAAAGRYRRASAVLLKYLERTSKKLDSSLVYYYLADFAEQLGDTQAAVRYSELGAKLPRHGFFPNRREDLAVLESA